MRLPAEELGKLEIAHRKAKSKKEGDKIKCIIAWGNGFSWELIKSILLISDGTIKNYVDAYQKGGLKLLSKTHYEGNHFNLTAEQEISISRYVQSYNVLRSDQVCNYVKRKFEVKYSTNGMTLLLKRLGFSYKKPKLRPPKVNRQAQKNFIWNYRLKMLNLPSDESVYFIDAAGFVHNARLDYGWIKKGHNKEIKAKTGRQKVNVNGAYNPKTHKVITVSQKTNMNTESNIALIKKVIEQDRDKKKITLILDNARMNYSKN